MNLTSEIAVSPARAHDARPFDRARAHGGRWERVVAVLGVCLPVPLLAFTGLSIPLPAVVERISAGLVAWTDASVDGADPLGLGDRGSIVLAAGERVLLQAPSGPEPDTARRFLASAPLAGATGAAQHGGTPAKDGGGSSGGGNGGSGGGTGGNGGDPADDPGLVEKTAKMVTEEPLVEEVGETLDESTDGLLEDALSDLGL